MKTGRGGYVTGILGALLVLVLQAVPCHASARPLQGVRGKVLKLEGNFMPTITIDGAEPKPPRNQRVTPLQVPVFIFKGPVKVFEKPDDKHPALLHKLQTKVDGSYECGLPPGEYTVVAEIGGKLYLNAFNADGCWSTVTVVEKQWKTWDIEDTSSAAF